MPLLADSLTAVTGKADIPAGYSTGIHMFGSDAAFNLNSNLYDWNKDAPLVFVCFNTDSAAPGAVGTAFTGGTLALTGGAGLLLGAAVAAISMTAAKKRKKTEPTTV